ncbi:MAG: 3-methyl-2-oxobutanoate hydroxymethyltransferase [Rhodospirillaceae bacterium]|nr:3-methyl-2-oxobutanoate hydroxymethyltransferase [Rhodospirillaceae bacterium]
MEGTPLRLTLTDLAKLRAAGEKLAMLTAYDASFATVADAAGVDLLLVGDSLGMVVQGHDSTLPVALEHMVYHTGLVARGAKRAMVIADMPFGSYQECPEQALRNAVPLLAAGAQMVKLEGGRIMADTVRFLVERGVPVCGHVGLTPQSVHQLGGYRVQGKTDAAADALLEEARAIQDAGAAMAVLEAIPSRVAKRLTEALAMYTIGIGAGPDCSGQVLVVYDMLDIYPGRKARFVKNFLPEGGSVSGAIAAYVKAVKAGTFPGTEHEF